MDAENSAMGCYVLIVVSEPISEDHKQVILQKLSKGLLSWDIEATGCDLTGLQNICSSVKEKNVSDNDVLIQYSTESLGVEVLVNPPVSTLKQCIKNLLESTTGHKHLIHAGYTFSGSGSWILGNGTFSFRDFLNAFQVAQQQGEKSCTIHVHCEEEGEWSNKSFAKETFSKVAKIFLNPSDCIECLPGSEHLLDCLRCVLNPQSLDEIMTPSPLVGNVRFNKPTIYVFPAGEGDCALFGVKGFNMIIDGGFNRKPCSWEFIRHLDRVDAVLVTHLSENNLCGISTLMKRKTINNPYPNFGYVFCNIGDVRAPSPTGVEELQKDKSDLLLSVVGEGHRFVDILGELKLKPHQCWGDNSLEPIVLYHKVGDGTLEMHILNPTKDSKEMKDFLSEWNSYKEKFSSMKSGVKNNGSGAAIPLPHATSICAILVWRPSDPKDAITRIFFSGSAPQSRILASVEKLKNLDILRQPMVTKASLSNVIIARPKGKGDKPIAKSLPNRKNTASPSLSVSSVASRNGDINAAKKEIMKRDGKILKKDNKDIKKDNKESKKDIKDIKQQTDKKIPTTITPRKSEPLHATQKSVIDAKKGMVGKKATAVPKKDASKSSVTNVRSVEKHDLKKTSPAKLSESKTAKDVSNKKAAEAKSNIKAKTKASPIATKTKTEKTKATPVPKAVSKVSKTSLSLVSAASLGAAIGSPLLSEATKEKEILASKMLDETAVVAEETAEKEKIPSELEIAPTPPDAALLTPSNSASPTPSDTLSSAPLETVSPIPLQPESSSAGEEKDVNEIKDITNVLNVDPEDNSVASDLNDVAVDTAEENLPLDPSKEGIHDIAIEESDRLGDEMKSNLISDNIDEDAIPQEKSTDNCMSSSFIDVTKDSGEDQIVEEEIISKSLIANVESTPHCLEECKMDSDDAANVESDDTKEKFECGIFIEEGTEEHLTENLSHAPDTDHDDAKRLQEIDSLLAGATMEGSICEGYGTINDADNLLSDFNANNKSTDEDVLEEEIVTKRDEHSIDSVLDEDNVQLVDSAQSENQTKKISTDTADLDSDLLIPKHTDLETEESTSFTSIDDHESSTEHQAPDQRNELQGYLEKKQYEENAEIVEESYEKNEMHIQNSEQPNQFYTVLGDETKCLPTSEDPEMGETNDRGTVLEEEMQPERFVDDTFLNSEANDDINIHLNSSEIVEDISSINLREKEINELEVDVEIRESPSVSDSLIRGDDHVNQVISSDFETPINMDQIYAADEIHDDEYKNIPCDEICEEDEDDIANSVSKDQSQELVRKESSVSIVLCDENDKLESTIRRESVADSEDDVDINAYMVHDPKVSEEGKLSVIRDSDSDDDVVKSPTPHALVEYEGRMYSVYPRPEDLRKFKKMEDFIKTNVGNLEDQVQNNDDDLEHYSSEEKQDFNEKDRDSAEEEEEEEEEEGDDEMIRHPTPPGKDVYATVGAYERMGMSDDMRDPITQHLTLSPMQGSDIIDEPLYEEPEDTDSEHSPSPVVEQPVYGNIVEADFPELVNVSGATTPSEPQSPKSAHDPRLKGNNFSVGVMEALSEHDVDCSEASLCHKEPQVLEENSSHEEKVHDAEGDDRTTSDANLDDETSEFKVYGDSFKTISNEDYPASADAAVKLIPDSSTVEMSSSIYGDFSFKEDCVSHNVLESNAECTTETTLETYSSTAEQSNRFEVMGHDESDMQDNYSNSLQDKIESFPEMSIIEEKQMISECVLTNHEINNDADDDDEEEEDEDNSDEQSSDHEECKPVEQITDDYSVVEESNIHENEEMHKTILEQESFHTSTTLLHETATTHVKEHSSLHLVEDAQLSLVCELNGNGSSHHEGYMMDNVSNNPRNDEAFTEVHPTNFQTEQESLNGINPIFQCDSQQDSIMASDLPGNPELTHDIVVPDEGAENCDRTVNCHLSETEAGVTDNTRFSGAESPSHKFFHEKEDQPYGESSEEDEDTSSLPGNVSPYAYTNKAYAQEEEENDDDERIQQLTKYNDICGEKSLDGGNMHPMTESFNLDNSVTSRMLYSPGFPDMNSADSNNDFHLEEWGKPMGLPTPPEAVQKTAKKISKSTVATKSLNKSNETRSPLENGKHVSAPVSKSPLKSVSKSKAPAAGEITPVYVDLAYVPHHGDPDYCDVEFFKKIRARYYVFSGINPSKEVLNALLEAKKSWKEDIEVTIIPTHETDTLGYWMAQNQDTLTEYSIDVAPSASRCTVNLQDHETSCAAYRLEF